MLSNLGILKKSYPLEHLRRLISQDSKSLFDGHGRIHDYLRISITERCNLRCRYCMPENGVELTGGKNQLSLAEVKRLADIFVTKCGITKIRLTGGEPTIDKKCMPLLGYLDKLRDKGLKEIAITTNGLTLKRDALLMKSNGLNTINISLDTMRDDRFEMMTRRKGWRLAFDGLKSALAVNFDSVKVNCVVMKGFNDDEIENFVNLASEWPIEVRFIEFMPFLGNSWTDDRLIPSKELLALALKVRPDLVRVPQSKHATSRVYSNPSMLGSIGFISSMTDNFCSGCNRLRLTSDGNLKVCLFGKEETSLRDLMRNGATDQEIVRAVASSLERKALKHAGADFIQRNPTRPMVRIASLSGFSHLDSSGNISMVNVGEKPRVKRIAVARGKIIVGREVLAKINGETLAKGNVISLSKIAGIMGAKLTSQLIPLCHNISLDHVQIEVDQDHESGSLIVTASVQACHNTGVEMESLTAVSVTLLAIYDMCKSVNKSMIMTEIELMSKRKGTKA